MAQEKVSNEDMSGKQSSIIGVIRVIDPLVEDAQ
jgi:hypothetical protein